MSAEVIERPPPSTSGVRARLRTLATSTATPDALRRVGAILVVGCLLAALVSLVSGTGRARAVSEGGGRIGELTADAAQLYHALADADAMATSGYVGGGVEPAPVRARYDRDVAEAAARLTAAAGKLSADDPAVAQVSTIAAQLPVYTALVETARTYNRVNLPLGQSYLSTASKLMTSTLLPAAAQLRSSQVAALGAAYADGGTIPFAPLLVLLAALAAVVDVSVRERRRTNRVLSPGLVVAAGALGLALLWWVVATVVAGIHLGNADRHADLAATLDDAATTVLQARSNESLVLVARTGGSADSQFTALLERVVGPDGNGGLLADVERGTDAADRGAVDAVRAATQAWTDAHRKLRELDDSGNYRAAVASATGGAGGSGQMFEALDTALATAAAAERRSFESAAGNAEAALTGLAGGPAVLAVLAAAGVVAGLGRRIGEYR